MDRIELAESLGSVREYEALPYSWDVRLRIRDTPDLVPCLTRTLAWIADGLDSWLRRRLGADLFAEVANEYDIQVLELLTNILASGIEETTLAIAAVLHEIPRTFIWD